ncbi:uncharacterized protein [Chanodichthys erythropterus]|uniref:uncharacterized protein isoform X2 n=1 Tax=Chanodichthys erythropterus TaxID=933992 RepID=UPI00351EECD7
MDEVMESQSHGALTVCCRVNARKIKRNKRKRQCKSKEKPPRMISVFNHLENELVALYLRDFPQIQQRMDRVCLLISTFEKDFRRASEAVTNAGNVEVAGGFMMGLGLVLAPVHLGISALITGSAVVVLSGAAISDKLWNKKIRSQQDKFIQDTEAELLTFQYIITPLTDKMRDISQRVHEILRDLNNPQHDVGYLSNYFSSASELVRFIQIYDISVLAAQIQSQTSSLMGTQWIRLLPVRMAFVQMWIEMIQLQNVMDEMTKTIERIAKQPG